MIASPHRCFHFPHLALKYNTEVVLWRESFFASIIFIWFHVDVKRNMRFISFLVLCVLHYFAWQFCLEEGGGCFSLNACIVSDANGKRGESRKLKPTSIRERPSTITHFQPDSQFIICYSAKHRLPYVFPILFLSISDKIHRPQA